MAVTQHLRDDLRALVDAGGQLEVKPQWGGNSSEIERRDAGEAQQGASWKREAAIASSAIVRRLGHRDGLAVERRRKRRWKTSNAGHRRNAVRQLQERTLAAHAAQPDTEGDLRCIDDAAADVPGLSTLDESQRRANAVWRRLPAHSRCYRRHDESSRDLLLFGAPLSR